MLLEKNFLMNNSNISITIKASDLIEVINYTVTTTRKELEQVIIDKNSEIYLSPKEVSKLLGVNTTTLWRWNKRGYLIPIEVGGKRKYRKSDIDTKCLSKSINLN